MDQYGITDGSYGLHVEGDPSLGVAGDTFLRTLGEVSPATARAEPAPMAGGRADPVEAIVALLGGTRNDRFGPRMDEDDHEVIRAHVGHWVGGGQPVHLLVMWGGLKHYVTDEEQGIDLAELFPCDRCPAWRVPSVRFTRRGSGSSCTSKTSACGTRTLAATGSRCDPRCEPTSSCRRRYRAGPTSR